jgi:hypothetical protein
MHARRMSAPESGGQVRGFDLAQVVAAIFPLHTKTFAASLRDAAALSRIREACIMSCRAFDA